MTDLPYYNDIIELREHRLAMDQPERFPDSEEDPSEADDDEYDDDEDADDEDQDELDEELGE